MARRRSTQQPQQSPATQPQQGQRRASEPPKAQEQTSSELSTLLSGTSESLSPEAVLKLQRALGNQATGQLLGPGATLGSGPATPIMRAAVALGTNKNNNADLREGPSKKAKRLLTLRRRILKRLKNKPDPDEETGAEEWESVEVFAGDQRGTTGFVKTTDFELWGDVEDTRVGHVLANTTLKDRPDKQGKPIVPAASDSAFELLNGTVVGGYVEVKLLGGSYHLRSGFIDVNKINTANLPINLKGSKALQNKDKRIMGDSKAGSEESVKQTIALLHQGPEGAAQEIFDALTSGHSKLSAFQRIAMRIAGQPGTELVNAFAKISNGANLKSEITRLFSGDPGPQAAAYLVATLDNNGVPPLKYRVMLAMGMVDNSGNISRLIAQIPKLGGEISSKGDDKRVLSMIESASESERHTLWHDTTFMAQVQEFSGKVYLRIEALVNVERLEKTTKGTGVRYAPTPTTSKGGSGLTIGGGRGGTGGQTTGGRWAPVPSTTRGTGGITMGGGRGAPQQPDQLALARDEQLARFVEANIDKKGLAFKAKAFFDDMVEWKTTARQEDLDQINKPNSRFRDAFSKVSGLPILGLSTSDRAKILTMLSSLDSDGSNTQIKAVMEHIKEQKVSVNRGGGTGQGVRGMALLRLKIVEGKWRDLETEIGLLDPEQRPKLLDQLYPQQAGNLQAQLTELELDLRIGGVDKETRASIKSLFNVDFGEAGDNYTELWVILNWGQGSRLKSKLPKQKEAPKALLKVVKRLEGSEFAQVRQDKALMTAMKTAINGGKEWELILTLLGMADENDQLQGGGDSRVLAETARKKAEHDPKHWAVLLAESLDETTITKEITTGGEKAFVMGVAARAQAAAREFAEENKLGPNGALQFMQAILHNLNSGDQRIGDYLRQRIPAVYAALDQNTPISTETRLERAQHEGFALFGSDKLRKGDRQKIVWTFMDLQGKQLLDDWSNIGEFRAGRSEMQRLEDKLTRDQQRLDEAQKQDPQEANRVKALQNSISLTQSQHKSTRDQLNTFVLGIRPDRRSQLKGMKVNAQDRTKMEGMLRDKLIDAMKNDLEVQQTLAELKLPYDKYMQTKMKVVGALESQRHTDTERQWHMFSVLGSELDETTRSAKGAITSTEQRLDPTTHDELSDERVRDIRKEGVKQGKEALQDRELVQAKFRDMQRNFRDRAMLIWKLIALGIVTGLTAGIGAPISIGVMIGVEAGLQVLEGLFKYYVLRETDVPRLIVDAGMNLIAATVRQVGLGFGEALNASVLNPAIIGEHLDWIGPTVTKGLGSLVKEGIMFMPEATVEKFFQDKELEKVVKEGEDTYSDMAVKQLLPSAGKFLAKVAKGGLMELGELAEEGMTGVKTPTDTRTQKSLGQGFTDYMMGGKNQPLGPGQQVSETEHIQGQYTKPKEKAVKKQAIKVLLGNEKETKQAEGKVHKRDMKQMRKEPKSPLTKAAIKVVLDHPGLPLLTLIGEIAQQYKGGQSHQEQLDTIADLRSLSEDDKTKLEQALLIGTGELSGQLDKAAQGLQMALRQTRRRRGI